jgi:hypothetical protein
LRRSPANKELGDTLIDPAFDLEVQVGRMDPGCIERIGPRLDRAEAMPAVAIRELNAVALASILMALPWLVCA